MVGGCSFLRVADAQQLFAAGKAIQGERVFQSLKGKTQRAVHEILARKERPSLYFARLFLGSIFSSIAASCDDKIHALWKECSSEQKGKVLETFINKKVADKLYKEIVDATRQGLMQKDQFSFEVAPTHFPSLPLTPLKSAFYQVVWVITSLVKGILFPWGIHSLYRFVQERDRSSFPFGIAHLQGKRSAMEDTHLVTEFLCRLGQKNKKVSVFGIFDGHGGDSAAQFAKVHFANCLRDALEKHASVQQTERGIFMACKEACLQLDKAYMGNAGTTLAVAAVIEKDIWICNVGDSRVIATLSGTALQLSEDQKCDNEKYARGVRKARGMIWHNRVVDLRSGLTLAMPRAIGDHQMRKPDGSDPILKTPKITKIPLADLQEGYLIIGCDGLWDVSSSRQVAAFVEANRADMNEEAIAKALVAKAYHAGSSDNISALVVHIKEHVRR